ncbi:MAG TPA: ATP-binding protein [Candidatus Eisenbacteria bacterium]|nr:ATP-binding protein [Candidatus Eisenbacteria bacterium]
METTTFRHVLKFGVISLIPVVLLAVPLTWGLDQQATAHAIEEAKHESSELARAVIEPDLPAGLVTGDGDAVAAMDRIVQQRVLDGRVVRVKIWSLTGKILYSDEHRLIGSTYRLDADDMDAITTGAPFADLSDLVRPENRYEVGYGQLLEVYTEIRPAGFGPLLFEAYIRYDALVDRARRVLLGLLPSLFGGLLLLELALLPLAWRLARRVRDGQRDRQRLVQHAVEASRAERRRIAADVHDSTVQDFVATSYSLTNTGRQLASTGHVTAAEAVHEAARAMRHAIHHLRTLVDIYPPSLHRNGLEAALRGLVESAGEHGLQTDLTLPQPLAMDRDAEQLIYRTAQEAVRNAVAHAAASRIAVSLQTVASTAVLVVQDDGRGFTFDENGPRQADGHLGLALLGDLARDAGGRLDVSSEPGRGTTVRLQVSL